MIMHYSKSCIHRAGRAKYAHFNDTGNSLANSMWEASGLADDRNPQNFSLKGPSRDIGVSERSSTPLHFLSGLGDNSQQLDPSALCKISAMEGELAALRKQIADLVTLQETKALGLCLRKALGLCLLNVGRL